MFRALPDPDGQHRLIVESALAQPSLTVPSGDYVVHVAFGLASATKSVTVAADAQAVKLTLQAGALRIHCTANGDKPDRPRRRCRSPSTCPSATTPPPSWSTPRRARDEVIGVPEGNYHIASTYLDTVGVGSLGLSRGGAAIPTNSIAAGDVNVAHRQDRRRDAAPPHRDADDQAGQRAGRRARWPTRPSPC